ncbi:MAG TPA: hypothetical protein VIZ86_07105 [Pseudomonas sp.]
MIIDPGHSLLIDCGLPQSAETSSDGKADAERLEIDIASASVAPRA